MKLVEMSRAPSRPHLTLSTPNNLHILDMGLDFRSYLSRRDENDVPILGNVISFLPSKIADVFEPTVGLLVTVLHLFAQSETSALAFAWIKAYDTLQKVFIEHEENGSEASKYAQEARHILSTHLFNVLNNNDRSCLTELLCLLDSQSRIKGSQSPSQRKIPRDPKGAFCNLHLADHKCYQEFACNQFHLHEAGPVRHRLNFFQRLTEILIKEKLPRGEIHKRIKDSIFFARYGNKVTVRCHNSWIPFFKTIYTDGRLEQAFRIQQYSCNDMFCTNEHCKGIHCQDCRILISTKSMELHRPHQISSELDEEAEHILTSVENSKPPNDPVDSLSISSSYVLSPTAELWRNTVRDYVRQSGISQIEADESLLQTLKDAKVVGTPISVISERMTPLLDGLETYGFNSSFSSLGSEHPS
ncbi:unnamed protein product [Phytomonas sp. Hart1]|nr:unnamed protein product [Phytomonas sp. Hart1]|eukprot:CCW70170.1 unnamed protein product [Phytomonas sp. isolate Hart1]